LAGPVIIVGEFGRSPIVDKLAAEGRLETDGIRGQWESDVIQVIDHPWRGVDRALVIAGSDQRGAIYGIYDLSRAIGVSPWYWWADVPVAKQTHLWIAAGTYCQGPPAVKYRGIFLNDEDWGLRPWAARTNEPETGNIGPKTYARIFELLLRLRGNLLWPAMHPGTRAFNFYPNDKVIADEYGIVMGSSHAEPMLRDNVDEWSRDGHGEYDYATNRTEVLNYWETRVRENAKFESIYTEGMRGIHDGPMEGGGTLSERAERLRGIIADQRNLLRRWVRPDLSGVPQMFCPYKEVLPIYRSAPDLVPDDVTLVWPDDNYGYIQHFSSAAERSRAGGGGVYYHVSYWGAPYDYLWLCSTPPALIGEEMTKAWTYDARKIWVLNVGDLKPAEIDTEFFLWLAWDPRRWSPEDGQSAFLRTIAARDFGAAAAQEVAAILNEYYRLNFQRKPEHMGVDPTSSLLAPPPGFSLFTPVEAQARLAGFGSLAARADALAQRIRPSGKDAFFELVQYPVDAAALMNRKGLSLSAYYAASAEKDPRARGYLADAIEAQAAIDAATRYFNTRIADGKWRGIMSDIPRDLPVFELPPTAGSMAPTAGSGWQEDLPGIRPEWLETWTERRSVDTLSADRGEIVLGGSETSQRIGTALGAWRTIGGLGYTGKAVEVYPTTASVPPDGDSIRARAPCLHYDLDLPHAGKWQLTVRRVPTWPIAGGGIRYGVSFDNGPIQIVVCAPYGGENDRVWQQDVLHDASYSASLHNLTAGRHDLEIWAVDPGLVIDSIRIAAGIGNASYAWPKLAPAAPAGFGKTD